MGSVKANLGHLEAASGVTGLIKLCMCYKYGAIPPVANLGEPNPAIPFDSLGLRLPTTLEPLPAGDDPIFFAINSFGYGGTNAHAILENPPVAVVPARDEQRHAGLLPVSARSEAALRAMVARYRDTLSGDSTPWLEVCAAAGLRRTHHDFRAAFVGGSRDELIAHIDEWLSVCARHRPSCYAARRRRAAAGVRVQRHGPAVVGHGPAVVRTRAGVRGIHAREPTPRSRRYRAGRFSTRCGATRRRRASIRPSTHSRRSSCCRPACSSCSSRGAFGLPPSLATAWVKTRPRMPPACCRSNRPCTSAITARRSWGGLPVSAAACWPWD